MALRRKLLRISCSFALTAALALAPLPPPIEERAEAIEAITLTVVGVAALGFATVTFLQLRASGLANQSALDETGRRLEEWGHEHFDFTENRRKAEFFFQAVIPAVLHQVATRFAHRHETTPTLEDGTAFGPVTNGESFLAELDRTPFGQRVMGEFGALLSAAGLLGSGPMTSEAAAAIEERIETDPAFAAKSRAILDGINRDFGLSVSFHDRDVKDGTPECRLTWAQSNVGKIRTRVGRMVLK